MIIPILFALALETSLSAAALPGDAAPPQSHARPLPPEDEVALRCGAVFAIAAKAQERGEPGSESWAGLNSRGREFFARSGAAAMDHTGMTKDELRAAVITMVLALNAEITAAKDGREVLAGKVETCLPLLPPEPAPAR